MYIIKLIFTLIIAFSGIISAAEMKMNEMTKEEAYTILSQASGLTINSSSTENEIKRAYRKSLLKWHPDKNLDQEEKATTNTKWVNHAYQILTREIQPTPSSSSSSSFNQKQYYNPKHDNVNYEKKYEDNYSEEKYGFQVECAQDMLNMAIKAYTFDMQYEFFMDAMEFLPSNSNSQHIKNLLDNLIIKKRLYLNFSSDYFQGEYAYNQNGASKNYFENFIEKKSDLNELILNTQNQIKEKMSSEEIDKIHTTYEFLIAKSQYYLGLIYLEKNDQQDLDLANEYLTNAKKYFENPIVPIMYQHDLKQCQNYIKENKINRLLKNTERKLQEIAELKKEPCVIQ